MCNRARPPSQGGIALDGPDRSAKGRSRIGRIGRGFGTPNVARGAAIGAVLTIVFHLALVQTMLGSNDFWRRKFIGEDLGSSWIPVTIVFFGFWGLGILALKLVNVGRGRRALRLIAATLPSDASTVTGSTALRMMGDMASLPTWTRRFPAYARTRIALLGASRSRNADEIREEVLNRSALEANIMETSFIPVGAFLWAIPIMGVLGTTIGLSQAVANFAGALDPDSDFAQLIGELGKVTPSLALAFDTTMVALGVSILLFFEPAGVRQRDEDALAQLDEFCLAELLPRVGGQQSAVARALDLSVQVEHLASAIRRQEDVQDRLVQSLGELRGSLEDLMGARPGAARRSPRGLA